MTNQDFKFAVLLRLGLPQTICALAKKCICGDDMDEKGYHALDCNKGGIWQERHDNIRNAFADIVRSTGLKVSLELVGAYGPDQRRADLACAHFVDGGQWMGDVSVTSVHAASYVAGAAKKQGFACQKREQKKNSDYVADAHADGVRFRFDPLVFETMGLVGENVLKLLRDLARYAAQDANKRLSSSVEDYVQTFQAAAMQRLGVCLQKGNAANLFGKAVMADHLSGNSRASNWESNSLDVDVFRPGVWLNCISA
jgi:hypothetical protein